MTKFFITGATGFIGSQLSLELARKGHTVHALYRSESKLAYIRHERIIPFKGDITDIYSIKRAMAGCSGVFHVAAFAKAWIKNPGIIFTLNVDATETILELAREEGIEKIVVTSSAGVLGPSNGNIVNETTLNKHSFFTHYEEAKARMEINISKRCARGENIVIVNPTRVYGPGPLNQSNSVTIMIDKYDHGKWRIIPGNGQSIGNYAYIKDVVNGHILAMQDGRLGERYILGGVNISYNDFFNAIGKIKGKNYGMIHIPYWLMMCIAHFMMLLSKIGIPPAITPSLVKKFSMNWNLSSSKAINELKYEITPFKETIQETLNWLRKE
ncbi:MAG: NAD-dependent epimerase/dehydratase family protein [bacterium]